MGDTRMNCPKCGSAMGRGHMPDVGYGAVVQEKWTAGDPQEIRFLGMSGGIRPKPKESFNVVAYRCTKCGFLEMYAPPT